MGEIVTVKSYSTIHELYNDKNLLDANGIECYAVDLNLDIIIGVYSAQGCKLQVGEADKDKAIELLHVVNTKEDSDYPIYPRTLLYIIGVVYLIFIILHRYI